MPGDVNHKVLILVKYPNCFAGFLADGELNHSDREISPQITTHCWTLVQSLGNA